MDKESRNWFRYAKLLIDIGSNVLRTVFSLQVQTSCFDRYRSVWLKTMKETSSNFSRVAVVWRYLVADPDYNVIRVELNNILKSCVEEVKDHKPKLTFSQQLYMIRSWGAAIQSKMNSLTLNRKTKMQTLGSKIENEICNLTSLCDVLKHWTTRFFELVDKYQQGLQVQIENSHDACIRSCQRKLQQLNAPMKHDIENFVETSQNDVQIMLHTWSQKSQEYLNSWIIEFETLLASFQAAHQDENCKLIMQYFLNGISKEITEQHSLCKNEIQEIDRSWKDDLQVMFKKWLGQIKEFEELGLDFKGLIQLWCTDIRDHHSSIDYQVRDFFHQEKPKLSNTEEERNRKYSKLSKLFPTDDFPDVHKFDITQLIVFLINLCHVCPPDLGWYRETVESDLSVGADLMRLRSCRNDYIGHIDKASIPETKFNDLWNTAECVLSRLASHCGDCFQDQITNDIANLKKCPLEPEREIVFKGEVMAFCENAILVDISDISLLGAMTAETVGHLMEMYHTVQITEQNFFQSLPDDSNEKIMVARIRSKQAHIRSMQATSPQSLEITSKQKYLAKAVKLRDGNPAIYKISPESNKDETQTKKFVFGEPRPGSFSKKTIMLFGTTGVGKLAMVDGMLNYILGVDLDDSWRFTIQHLMDKDQANQRTNCITWYEVNYQHGNRLKYNLNIIDTPEFCDTRGIDEDKKIVDQIRAFFMTPGDQGIDNIDAICFVTKAALASLTHTHHYFLDSILSLFGKDAKDNIFVLMTFADGKEPSVLEALKKTNFLFKQSFSFNSSGLPDCAYSSEQFDKFFEELNHVQQTSLQQTAEVLAIKKQIENTIDCLLPQIRDGLNQLNTIKQEINVLKNHKNDVYWDRDFSYSLKEIQQRKVDTKPGRCVTNCFVCSFTCHLDCKYTDDNDKKDCSAMGPDGNCTKCTGKCHWTKHKNRSFYYETNVQERVEKYEKLKAKYGGGLFYSSSETNAKSHYKSVRQNVMGMMKTAREATNKLEQGSLKPNILNEDSYVNCLIESVKRERTAGWEDQVTILEEIKSGRESQGSDEDSKYTGCQLC